MADLLDGGRNPAWSRDGKEWFFLSADGSKPIATAVKTLLKAADRRRFSIPAARRIMT
jgi:hypothetical protein